MGKKKKREEMEMVKMSLEKLNPAKYNPRVDLQPGDPRYERIRKSLKEFGLVEPLVWNKRTGNLVGGHQRLKQAGETEAWVSVVKLDEKREKALNLALNNPAGEWDHGKLRGMIQELQASEIDLEVTGFGREDIKKLLEPATLEPVSMDDLLKELDVSKAVDRPIWLTVRAGADKKQLLERAAESLKVEGTHVEKSWEGVEEE